LLLVGILINAFTLTAAYSGCLESNWFSGAATAVTDCDNYCAANPTDCSGCSIESAYFDGETGFNVVANGYYPYDIPGCTLEFYIAPPNSSGPPGGPPSCSNGSIIHNDTQAVGESIPVVGAPFTLTYFSDRVLGRAASYQIQIPITGSGALPSGTTGETLTVTYAGNTFTQTFTTTANQTYTFSWNGLDSSSNPVQGSIIAQTGLLYTGSIPYPIQSTVIIGGYRADLLGLGGWVPSILHYYDINTTELYFGDGTNRVVTASLYNSGTQYIAANDNGSELYVFDLTGKHLKTLNGLTGSTIYAFAYDTNNHLSTITDAYSNVTTVVRNMSGVLTGIQSPYSQTTGFTLDGNGFLATVTNPNSETYTMTYSSTGLLNTFQKPAGQTSTMTFDLNGLLTLDSSSAGNSTSLTAGIDLSSGNPSVTTTSNLGISTEYVLTLPVAGVTNDYSRNQYDPDGTQSDYFYIPNQETEVMQYGTTQTTNSTTDARLGSIANFPYSSLVSTADSTWSENSTQNMGTWTQTGTSTNPLFFNYTTIDTQNTVNSNLWDSKYTLSTGETVVTSPKSRKTYFWNDTYGKLTKTQLATYQPVQYSYDTHGRLSGITQSTRSSAIAYNTSSFMSSFTDALSEVTSFTYDGAGRVLTETLPDTRVITNTYDSNGNLTSITPASSNEHSFTYNGFDSMSEYLPPALTGLSVNTTYTYNNDKKLTQITRPDGNTAVYSYDPTTGYLINIVVPSGTYTFTSSEQSIDTAESPDSISDSLSYSGNQITQDEVTNATTTLGSMSFAYNNDFNMSSSTVTPYSGSSSAINYTYDTDTLLTAAGSETITSSSTTGQVTNTTLSKVKDTTTYDSNYGEPSSYVAYASPSPVPSPIISEGFTRDALGRISAESVSLLGAAAVPYGYTYDAAGRLTAVTKSGSSYSSYTYDNNSNRTSGNVGGVSFTATFDAEDRMLTYNTKTFTYTVNGDLATIVDSSLPSGHQTTTFTFDELGNLKQVITPSTTVNYKLDGFNRRVQKINGTTVQATYLYHNQNQIEAVLTATGTLSERFVYGTKPNVPDYVVKSGTTYRIISDERGSVRFVVNASTGAIAQHIEYDEFGNVLSDTSAGFQPFYFAGCLYDQDTKMCHFGARDYDASTGRWLSKDPLLFGGGDTNLYGYTMNDPINLIDSAGTDASGAVIGGCVTAIGAGVLTLGGKKYANVGIGIMAVGAGMMAYQSSHAGVTVGGSCGGGGGGPGGWGGPGGGFPGGGTGGWAGPGGGWVGGPGGGGGGNSGSGGNGSGGGSGGANSCSE
jgi:RHS repeat-associated protein